MRILGFNISRAKNKAETRRGVYAGGGKYRIVSTDENLRERGIKESGEEFDILDSGKRSKLLDMARNQVRNSPTFNAMLKQFELNGVGSVGGKATFMLGEEVDDVLMREAFAEWAQSAEFYDGLRLNELLKVVLKTYLVGGECVLVFDDGLVEDSGRVLLFEPDEVANIPDEAFDKWAGEGWQQIAGHVLNANGRQVGVFVSRFCRGEKILDPDACYKLVKDANARDEDILWINPRNMWRKNQVIGVSPAASSLATTIDLEDLTNYDLQAAKKNAQTLAQVIQDKQEEEAPSAFDAGTDFASMTDDELSAAVSDEVGQTQSVSLDRIKGAGCLYEVMPEGTKLELLDTKHPNPNMPDFIDWLAGRSVAPFGLSRMFATMKVDQSFSGCQGEMNMSWPAFEEAQKFLERICDWILVRWAKWAARKGVIPSDVNGFAGIARRVSWAWPRQRAVNAVDEQTAIEKRLSNCTGSYRDIYGADWKAKLNAVAEEIKFCKENGIPHPATMTVSGAVVNMDGESETEAK